MKAWPADDYLYSYMCKHLLNAESQMEHRYMYIASAVIPPPLQSGLLVTSISTREGEIGVGCSSAVGTWRRKRGRRFLDNASAATLAFPSTYVGLQCIFPPSHEKEEAPHCQLVFASTPRINNRHNCCIVSTNSPAHSCPHRAHKVLLAAAP